MRSEVMGSGWWVKMWGEWKCYVRVLVALLLVFFAAPAFSDSLPSLTFKDVPPDHWAAKGVYDLVNMGITQGYPDGTFRGKNGITRYETAVFLSKLSDKLGVSNADQMKTDINSLRNDILESKKSNGISVEGAVLLSDRIANVLASRGAVISHGPFMRYRLQTSISKDFGDGSYLKVNFDTMDSGYYGVSRDLATEMLDVCGAIKVNPADVGLLDLGFSSPLDISMTFGPGIVQYSDKTNAMPSDSGYLFFRPYSGLSLKSKYLGIGFSLGYFETEKTNSGQALTDLIKGSISNNFDKFLFFNDLRFNLEGSIYSKHPSSSNVRDLRAKLDVSEKPNQDSELAFLFGIGGAVMSDAIVGAGYHSSNFMGLGSDFGIKAVKVGSQFISKDFITSEVDAAGVDCLGRALQNSLVNIDFVFTQPVTNKFSLSCKSNIRLSSDFGFGSDKLNSKADLQFEISYMFLPKALVNAYYRLEKDPAAGETTDLFGLDLRYNF